MRFGFFIFSSAEDSVWRAVRAEAEGFDSVWFPEFVTRRPDGREHTSPISGMSYVAAITRRIKLGTAVVGALKHHPAVLSQEVATVDRLSGGRVLLGLGPGARRQSVALDVDRPWSSDYLIEYIEVMKSMWGWKPVKYHGKHFNVDGAPAVRPHGDTIPVYVGAFSKEARTAAAAVGDGWMANWVFSPDVFSDIMSEIRDGARRAGRDPSGIDGFYLTGVAMTGERDHMIDFARRMAFGVMPKIQLQDYGARLLEMAGYKMVVEEPSQVPEEFVERTFLIGDRDDVIGRIEEYGRAGVGELLLYFADEGSERSFVEDVIPYFRGS